MVTRYGKIKKQLRTIHANHDLNIRELLLGVSLHFWKFIESLFETGT